MTLIARFRVDSFEPRQVSGLGTDWLGLMTFAKTFTSGIIGQSTTLFMSAGTQEGSRSYVATERISGRTDDGREGSVTVQHGGVESDPDRLATSCPAPVPAASRAGPAQRGSSMMIRAHTLRSRWPEHLGWARWTQGTMRLSSSGRPGN